MLLEPKQLYEFGSFRLDSDASLLWKEGEPVSLTPKAFEILQILVERQGRLVEKAELMNKVWPDIFVEEGNLTFNVFVLRKALGDGRQNGNRFIETVPRRGYRFIAPVKSVVRDLEIPQAASGKMGPPEPVASARSHVRSRWLHASLGVALAALALVPFLLMRPRPIPSVLSFTQLTSVSRVMENSRLLTDGLNLYFGEWTTEGPRMAQVAATGGETVPLQPSFRALPVDISAQRHELLVGGPPLFHSQTGLYILPLPGGSPRRLGDNLLAQDASFCGGQQIAYASGQSLYVTNLNATDRLEIATIPSGVGIPSGLRCSPDGRVLRFEVDDVSHRLASGLVEHSLWEVSVGGGTAQNLLPGWHTASMIPVGSWTADGKYYVFAFPRDGTSDIWALPEMQGIFRRSRREPVRLTHGPLNYSSPLVSTDGRTVFAIGQVTDGELVRYDSRLHEFVGFLNGISAWGIAYSPAGRSVAYIKYPGNTLWRMKADGTQQKQLTFEPVDVDGAAWSPDGAQIAIRARRPGQAYGVYLIPAQGGDPQKILPWDHEEEGVPTWSLDGKRLTFGDVPVIFGHATGKELVHVYDLTTRELIALPSSTGLWTPRWSPDGRYIAALTIPSPEKLSLFDFARGKWRELGAGPVNNPTWSHDSRYIYFDSPPGSAVNTGIFRVRISDGYIEMVTGFGNLRRAAPWWSGLTPNDEPLILRDIGTSEIYALDVDWR